MSKFAPMKIVPITSAKEPKDEYFERSLKYLQMAHNPDVIAAQKVVNQAEEQLDKLRVAVLNGGPFCEEADKQAEAVVNAATVELKKAQLKFLRSK